MSNDEKVSHEKEFTKSTISINPCKLSRDDLTELLKKIEEAFPEDGDNISLEISTKYGNTNIKARSITDFLEVKDFPDKLHELHIRCSKKGYYISLDFMGVHNSLYVSGKNEPWVLGNYQRLESFLQKKRPWFYSRKHIFLIILLIVGISVFIASILISKKYYMSGFIIYGLLLLIYIIIMVSDWNKYFPNFVLDIIPQTNIINKDLLIIVLTILTLIATIIGGIIVPFITTNK
ncbi:MAG: hypothetical protein Q8N13_20640 [Acidovorax sp.]|nr:hypothetical protein [Acidovorax sp.]